MPKFLNITLGYRYPGLGFMFYFNGEAIRDFETRERGIRGTRFEVMRSFRTYFEVNISELNTF